MDKNLIPPKKASDNAKLGLKLRQKYHRGGLSLAKANSLNINSGITRAKQLTSGKPLNKKDGKIQSSQKKFSPRNKTKRRRPYCRHNRMAFMGR